ncbi:hypothetical protein Bbelb_096980 [Branchiostoma belcheri]|nr:hypothetical protein Bbelb_096980 [Branchiostoma belcheri]
MGTPTPTSKEVKYRVPSSLQPPAFIPSTHKPLGLEEKSLKFPSGNRDMYSTVTAGTSKESRGEGREVTGSRDEGTTGYIVRLPCQAKKSMCTSELPFRNVVTDSVHLSRQRTSRDKSPAVGVGLTLRHTSLKDRPCAKNVKNRLSTTSGCFGDPNFRNYAASETLNRTFGDKLVAPSTPPPPDSYRKMDVDQPTLIIKLALPPGTSDSASRSQD